MAVKKPADKGPNNAYLMSFGDTMTTLLAFFIVLNSLAEEQTGANLYRGTGSFVRTLASFGLPGTLPGSGHSSAVRLEAPGPIYVVPHEGDADPDRQATGPDENSDDLRIIDREREDFERFVNELERLSEIQIEPALSGEVVFDIFNALERQPPYLGPAYRDAVGHVLPSLYDAQHRVELTVWATTPSASAWNRAAQQAVQLRHELTQLGQLKQEQLSRLTTSARPWIDSVAKRPTVTITVQKVDAGGPREPGYK